MMHPDVAVLLIQLVALFYITDVDSAVVVVDRLQKRSEPDISEDVQPAVGSRKEGFLPFLMFLDSQMRWEQSRNAMKKRLAEEERMRDDLEAWERILRGETVTEGSGCDAECQKRKRAATIEVQKGSEEIVTHTPNIKGTTSSANTSPVWKGWWDLKNKDFESNLVESELGSMSPKGTEELRKDITAGTFKGDRVGDKEKGEEVTTAAPTGEGDRCKSCCCKCPQKEGDGEPMCSDKCGGKETVPGDHRAHQGGDHRSHKGGDSRKEDHHSHHDNEGHSRHEGDHSHHGGDHGHHGGDHSHHGGDHRVEVITGDDSHPAGDHIHLAVGHSHPVGDHSHPVGDHSHPVGDHSHHAGDHSHHAGDHSHHAGDHSHHAGDHSHHAGDHSHRGCAHSNDHHGTEHHHASEIQHYGDSEIERALENGDVNTLMAQCLHYLGVTEAILDGQPDRVVVATRLCQRRVRDLLTSANDKDVVIIRSEPSTQEDDEGPLAVLFARNAAMNSETKGTKEFATNGPRLGFGRRQVLPTQQSGGDYETKKRVRKYNTGDTEQSTAKVPTDTKEANASQDEARNGSADLGTSSTAGNAPSPSARKFRSPFFDNQDLKGKKKVIRAVKTGPSLPSTSSPPMPAVEREVRSPEHSEETGFWESVKKFLLHFGSGENIRNSARSRRNYDLESDTSKDSEKIKRSGVGLVSSDNPTSQFPNVPPLQVDHEEKREEIRADDPSVTRSPPTKREDTHGLLSSERSLEVHRQKRDNPTTLCPPISLKDAEAHEKGHAICASPILLALAVLSILAKQTI